MAEQEKKPGGADGKKKKFYGGQFAKMSNDWQKHLQK